MPGSVRWDDPWCSRLRRRPKPMPTFRSPRLLADPASIYKPAHIPLGAEPVTEVMAVDAPFLFPDVVGGLLDPPFGDPPPDGLGNVVLVVLRGGPVGLQTHWKLLVSIRNRV